MIVSSRLPDSAERSFFLTHLRINARLMLAYYPGAYMQRSTEEGRAGGRESPPDMRARVSTAPVVRRPGTDVTF